MSTLLTIGAGSPLMQQESSNKRHSRSLDLQPTARTRHLHHRSASESDGLELIIAVEKVSQEEEEEEPIPKSTIPSSNSVFSLYKKLGSPGRQRSINSKNVLPEISSNKRSQFQKSRASIGSAFAGFRQPSLSTNTLKHRFSTPINNPGKKKKKKKKKK
jgi:hypothetical protein